MQALETIDIAFITETWLTKSSWETIRAITGYGFEIHRADRGTRGGGIAVIYRNIECTFPFFPHYVTSSITSFEYHVTRLKTACETYCLICIYRKQEVHVNVFISEIDTLLDYATTKLNDTVIVLGDFNIHFDVVERDAINVTNVFNNYQLQPLVTEPTHRGGHTLDQIFYNRNIINFPMEPSISTELTNCDHYPIFFTIPCSRDTNKLSGFKETIHFRKLKEVDIEALRLTILGNLTPWYNKRYNLDDFSLLCAGFKNALQMAIDQHAPLRSMSLTLKPTANPHWFDAEYQQERRKRRSLERKYKLNKTLENKQLLSKQRDICYALVKTKREVHT